MYSRLKLAQKYIRFYLTASNSKGHGVHSPFVFDFIVHVLNDSRNFYAYETIETLREGLYKDKTVLEIEDFGSGADMGRSRHRTVASIARNSAKNKKLSQLLFRIVHYYQPKAILELGTSLGISSAYMAAANPSSRIITMEGAQAVARRAAQHHELLQLLNIELVTGNFDDTLAGVLQSLKHVHLAFIDGNHRFEPTVEYFRHLLPKAVPHSIFIFDDIHWSSEMEAAWRVIQSHEAVSATIDLFFMGIVLFRPEFRSKQHFAVRF